MTSFLPRASTLWTVIHSAREHRAPARDEFVRLYRPPVVRYLRGRGVDRETAEDLAQEVFLRIFQKELLRKVEQSKGRFRSFLLGVANNILREEAERRGAGKRGGGAALVSLEATGLEVAAGGEREFTRGWMLHLVRLAMKRLEETGGDAAKRDLAVFREFTLRRPSYETLSARFGLSTSGVKNALYETKQRLRREVGGLINAYTTSSDEFVQELAAFEVETLAT